jgi:hypothetical protein
MLLSIDELHNVLLIRFDGRLTDEVLLKGYRIAREWMAVHGPASQLSDFSEVTSVDVASQTVWELAKASPLAPDSFLRIVIAPQSVVFGLTRMFEMLGDRTRDGVHIVATAADANRLLGVDMLEFRAVLEG